MGQKLVVGPIGKGLKTNVLPFNNDSFPKLVNAYQWRGRVKRKRGTRILGRLQRWVGNTNGSGNLTVTLAPIPIAIGTVSFRVGTDVFTDPGTTANPGTQTLLTNGTGNGTLNRITGVLTITGSKATTGVIFIPSLPVMGLEDLLLNPMQTPGTIAFDTDYSYNISTLDPFAINDVSYYKNPAANSTTMPGYVPKDTAGNSWTPTTWNAQNYQQFWTTNYEGAFWATNGVAVPYLPTNIGMQFSPSTTITVVSQTATTLVLTITNCPLVIGDFVFVNEFTSTTPDNAVTLNFQTGYITACAPNTPALATKTVTITFPFAAIATDTYTAGMVQYLTTRINTSIDSLRFYDGDPTNSNPTNPTFRQGFGWVNFSPALSQDFFSIAGLPRDKYYLVGAKMIVPFKDRLLFFGAVVQTSATVANPIYLQDTVIYSQNGTPYYTASFGGDPELPTTQFNPLLVPINQTATAPSYWEDQTGFGGFNQAGLADAYISVSPNEDVLICGFNYRQARLIYSGNDIDPFNLFIINSELGTSSTFSLINMNEGIITKGNRGYIMTQQVGAQRIDLEIPDQVFEVNRINNGNERFCAQRDYINEWIFFTYPSNEIGYIFPTETLLYNYRDNSYALFYESYTTYGAFIAQSGQTWLTLNPQLTWATWNTPWTAGESTVGQPTVIAGNQQGFIVFRSEKTSGTTEANTLYIQYITGNTITCPNHCLNNGDYIVISGALGAIGSQVNGVIFSVFNTTTNTFNLNVAISSTGTDYNGGAVIQRMYVPFIQTKQFPLAWDSGQKTRIGQQQYLFTKTPSGQVTLQIYLSQNDQSPYNTPPIVPDPKSTNNSLIYNTVVFTSPEQYIQNCINLPLGTIGNGVLTSFTFNFSNLFDITTPGYVPNKTIISVGTVAVFIDNGVGGFSASGTGTSAGSSINYQNGVVTIAFTVAPTSQVAIANFQYYLTNLIAPTSQQQSQIWHRMNTSLIGDTVQLGITLSDTQMRSLDLNGQFMSQFAEIEFHGCILDVQPSQVLV